MTHEITFWNLLLIMFVCYWAGWATFLFAAYMNSVHYIVSKGRTTDGKPTG